MAQQWLSASDPYWSQFGNVAARDPESGEFTNPYISTIRGLQGLDNWQSVARQLGYQGPFETQVISTDPGEGGGGLVNVPAPEFLQFIEQKKAEGYDFVTKADQINKDRQTIGLRTPTGEVINQTPVKVSGFGDFFKEFVLPAVAAYGAVNFLGPRLEGLTNALSGGGAAAAPANTLVQDLAGNFLNAATGQVVVPAGAGAATGALTATDIVSGLDDVLGAASDTATGAEGVVEGAGAEGLGDSLTGAGAAGGGAESLSALDQAALDMGAGATNVGAATGGGSILDQVISFFKSPAGASALSGLGSLLGGVIQAGAAEGASEQQAEAARNALALSREMFDYQKSLLAPYQKYGTAALERLSGALGLDGAAKPQQALEMDPGYGFRLGEGMKALERMQAARGNMLSGGAMKAGQRYAQDYASGEYQNAYNRLANIAGLGQTTGTQLGTAASQFGQTAGNIMGQEANALAAGRIGRGSAYGGAIQGGLNAYSNYLNQQQQNQLFRDIFGRTAIGN